MSSSMVFIVFRQQGRNEGIAMVGFPSGVETYEGVEQAVNMLDVRNVCTYLSVYQTPLPPSPAAGVHP